jgi:Na+-transporting methylmalonyl-CoA/oxaloacetate decarboxylase gamma subunit
MAISLLPISPGALRQVSVILDRNMKPPHLSHVLIILSIFLIAVIFLAGVLHAFDSARAASATPAVIASHPVEYETVLTPTPVPTPASVSGDTTGIITLAILIVVIVLVGSVMGTNKPIRKKTS